MLKPQLTPASEAAAVGPPEASDLPEQPVALQACFWPGLSIFINAPMSLSCPRWTQTAYVFLG